MGKGRERARRACSLILSGLGSVILLGESWRVICKAVASVPQVIEMRYMFHWNPMRKSMRSGAEACEIQSGVQPFWLSEPVVCRRVVRCPAQAGFVPAACLAGNSVVGEKEACREKHLSLTGSGGMRAYVEACHEGQMVAVSVLEAVAVIGAERLYATIFLVIFEQELGVVHAAVNE